MSQLPSPSEYDKCLQQGPAYAFEDPELRGATVQRDKFGLPLVESGGFTLTYKLSANTNNWAIRCFKKDVRDRASRYQAIRRFLSDPRAQGCGQYFVGFSYLEHGLRWHDSFVPILKMQWVDGEPLNLYVERLVLSSQLQELSVLCDGFRQLISDLQHAGIAHGDLQHGNILVQGDHLFLVDYDGMFVPELRGSVACEIGHSNYQHPGRTEKLFDDRLDRFSSIVIYLALKAIALRPRLWAKYGQDGENLLFRNVDFVKSDQSPLLFELEQLPGFSDLIQRFRGICKGRVEEVPALDEFLAPAYVASRASPQTYDVRRPYGQAVMADQLEQLWQHELERIEVVGFVSDTFSDLADEPEYSFLHFGDWKAGAFVVVLWSDALRLLDMQHASVTHYKRKWVSVTGTIRRYTLETRHTWQVSDKPIERPEIILYMPSQVEILPNEQAARERAGMGQSPTISRVDKVELPKRDILPIIEPPSFVPIVAPPKRSYQASTEIGIGHVRDWRGCGHVQRHQILFQASDHFAFVLTAVNPLPTDQHYYVQLRLIEPSGSRVVHSLEFRSALPNVILNPLASVLRTRGKYEVRVTDSEHAVICTTKFEYVG